MNANVFGEFRTPNSEFGMLKTLTWRSINFEKKIRLTYFMQNVFMKYEPELYLQTLNKDKLFL